MGFYDAGGRICVNRNSTRWRMKSRARCLVPGLAHAVLGRLRTATYAITLPQLEPRTVRKLLIVPSIRSREIAGAHRPGIRQGVQTFQALDIGNDPVCCHRPPSSSRNRELVNRTQFEPKACEMVENYRTALRLSCRHPQIAINAAPATAVLNVNAVVSNRELLSDWLIQ
jgi:hypothetical protein